MSNLNVPIELAAEGREGRINVVTFRGNNDVSATYEIWRRHGDSGEWAVHQTTPGQSFEDAGVKPGQYYEYRVRAVSGDNKSEFSESAVTYGRE
jgi:hypothetical protein